MREGTTISDHDDFDLELLRILGDRLPVGLMVWTMPDLAEPNAITLDFINTLGCEATGVTPELVGKPGEELFPQFTDSGITQVVADLLDSGQTLDLGNVDFGDDRIARGTYRAILQPISRHRFVVIFERLPMPAEEPRTVLPAAFDDAVIECDLDGTVDSWDAAAVQVYGIAAADAIGRPLAQVVGAQDADEFADAFAMIRAHVHLHRVQSRQRTAGGASIHVVMTFTRRREAPGTPPGAIVTVRDTTDAARIQEDLEYVLAAGSVGFFDMDLATGLTARNLTHDEIFGYTELQRRWTQPIFLSHVHEDDRERVGRAFEEKLARGVDDLRDECRIVRSDGELRWITIRARVERSQDGTPRRVVGLVADVTDRKLAQLTAEEVTGRLTSLVDSLGDAVISTTLDGVITSWNHAAETLLGWSEQEAVGRHLRMVIPRDQRGQSERMRRAVMAGEVARDVASARQRKDGSLVQIEKTMSPLRAGDEVVGLIEVLRDVTDRREMERALRHEALHDALTGLPNRVLIRDRLQHAIAAAGRSGRPVSVLMLDLDNFKYVNDAAGHAEGDQLLTEVARRLRSTLRPGDTIARFGGDEFVVVCEETDPEVALLVADRLQRALAAPMTLGSRRVVMTASIGVAATPPDDADVLLRSADIAMYHAKASGRARSSVFGPTMAAHARAHLELSQELREAIETDALELHYQPVVDLASGELLGLEALARWMHPERGPIRPDEFIAVAEEVGLIESLDRWVLGRACADGAAMVASGLLAPSSRIAVNVGAQHISSGRLVANVAEALDSCPGRFDFSQLAIEVTETAVMRDLDRASRSLEELDDAGVSIALDDFGTGYSSLTYLQQLPISVLKIDRSFIQRLPRRPEDVAVAASIVDLASAVGIITVVAEGIETTEQLGILQAMHCSAGQGWLWSQAMPVADVAALMSRLPQRRFPVARASGIA